MEIARYDLGPVYALSAEAIGQPGKRTFRLLADSGQGEATLWLEKEQLLGLALAIHQVLSSLGEESGPAPPGGEEKAEGPAGEPAVVEFKIGRLSLGYDGERGRFEVWVHEEGVAEDEEAQPTLAFQASRDMMQGLAGEALAVCSAGRPICPLCQGPIDPKGHLCPRANGHRAGAR
ncbi:MAG: DUF3090 family protein [Nitrospinota bacterium]